MKRIIFSTLILLGALEMQAQQLSASIQETTQGKAWTMTVSLADVSRFSAMSLRMELPAELQAGDVTLGTVLQSTHQIQLGELENGCRSIILYSPQSTLLGATDATFAVRLHAATELPAGQYTVSLTDIRLADAQGAETKLENSEVVLQNNLYDAISLPQAQRKDAPVFTLDGRRIQRPLRPGIYVSQGRKFVVK